MTDADTGPSAALAASPDAWFSGPADVDPGLGAGIIPARAPSNYTPPGYPSVGYPAASYPAGSYPGAGRQSRARRPWILPVVVLIILGLGYGILSWHEHHPGYSDAGGTNLGFTISVPSTTHQVSPQDLATLQAKMPALQGYTATIASAWVEGNITADREVRLIIIGRLTPDAEHESDVVLWHDDPNTLASQLSANSLFANVSSFQGTGFDGVRYSLSASAVANLPGAGAAHNGVEYAIDDQNQLWVVTDITSTTGSQAEINHVLGSFLPFPNTGGITIPGLPTGSGPSSSVGV